MTIQIAPFRLAVLLLALCGLSFHVAIAGQAGQDSASKEARVAYGNEVPDPLLSHYVELQLVDDLGEAYCGGTLLRPGWIITAAHCMKGEYGGGVFGVNFVLHLDDGLRQLVVPENTTTAYIPKEYDPLNQPFEEQFYGDIALIHLPELVTIGNVQYPRLPESREEVNAAPVLVAGGVGVEETGQTGETLEFVTVGLASAVGETPAFAPWPIESDHFVTLDSSMADQDTCDGDSGGGIFIPSRSWAKETKDDELEELDEEIVGDEDVLVGITSYGSASLSCGGKGTFGVYTDVLYWKEWIERTIETVERDGEGASEGGSASPGR